MYDFFKRRYRGLLFLLLAFVLFFIIQNAGAKNGDLKNSDLDLNKATSQVGTENKHLLQENTETAPLAAEQPQENGQLALKPSIPEEPIVSDHIPGVISQEELQPSSPSADAEDPFLNDEFFNSFNSSEDKQETEAQTATYALTSTPASPIKTDSHPIAEERSPDTIAPLVASSQSESATPSPSSQTQSVGCHLGFSAVWMLSALFPLFCGAAKRNH